MHLSKSVGLRFSFRLLLYSLITGCMVRYAAVAQVDSTTSRLATQPTVMTSQDFFQQVLTRHPVARQAGLLQEQALAEIRLARGEFDPKLEATYETKKLQEKLYYHNWQSTLKIPTWIGELKGGYERSIGTYADPATSTSLNGLVFAGVSVPLPISRDFLIDQRRAVLRQAQVFQQIAEADRIKEVNKLLFQAAKDYWEWYFTYNEYTMLLEAYELARLRYEAVRGRVQEGDLAGIDSTDAQTIVQDRAIRVQQARIDVLNARVNLSTYLWGSDDTPLEMPENVAPEGFATQNLATATTLQRLQEQARTSHPELRKLVFKNDQLRIDQRFLRDRFKPMIRLNYNLLSTSGYNVPSDLGSTYMQNNYKWGFEFGFPLFLRKERGKLRMNTIKMEQNDLERIQRTREIINEIQMTYNDLRNLDSLIRAQEAILANYRRLRDGEVQRFDNGDSDLFRINVRETKLIDEQIKLFSLKSKYAKEKAKLLWAAGLNPNQTLE